LKVSGKVGNGPMNKRLNFGGGLDHRLDTGIVFRIRHCWKIRKVVSTDCAGHALAGIAIADTSPAHDRQPSQPVTANDVATLERRALAEVCAVPVLLVDKAADA